MKMCWLLNEGEDGETAVRAESSWSLAGWKVRSPLMGEFEAIGENNHSGRLPQESGNREWLLVTVASVPGWVGLRRLRCCWQSGKLAAKLCASWSRSRGD